MGIVTRVHDAHREGGGDAKIMKSIATRRIAILILVAAVALPWLARETMSQDRSESNAKVLDTVAARRIIAAAEKRAAEIEIPMNVAIVGVGGHLKAFSRMDGALLGSVDISMNKAFTARMFNTESKNLAAAAQSGGPLFGIHNSNDGRIVIFAGGIPLHDEKGEVIGAIGVSGGSVEQDQTVAEAGVTAF